MMSRALPIALYAGVAFDHFIYDSAKLGQVRNFATSPQIQIMVMTVGAINRKQHQHHLPRQRKNRW